MTARAPKTALTFAAIAALLSIPATYAIQRLVQDALFPDPNPALVTASLRIAMFWRLEVSLPIALVIGIGTHAAAQRNAALVARVLEPALYASASLLVLQSILRP